MHLRSLLQQGILQRHGGGRNTSYTLSDPFAALDLLPDPSLEERAINRVCVEFLTRRATGDPWIHDVRVANTGLAQRPFFYFDVKNIIHPAFATDADFVMTAWSGVLEEMFGRPSPEQTFSDFFQNYEIIPWQLDAERDCAAGGHFIDGLVLPSLASTPPGRVPEVDKRLCRYTHPDRGEIYLEVSFVAQRGYPGVQSMMPVATERVRMIREIRAQNSRWLAMNHRLRQPMNGINGITQWLDLCLMQFNFKEVLNEFSEIPRRIRAQDLNSVEAIESTLADFENNLPTKIGEFQSDLIKILSLLRSVMRDFDLFLRSYPTARSVDMEDTPISILAVLQDAISEEEQATAAVNGVEIAFHLRQNDRDRFTGTGDPYLLREAFYNILHNAIQACSNQVPEHRRVTVEYTFKKAQRELTIRIMDCGPGMPDDRIRKLNDQGKQQIPASLDDLGRVSGITIAMRLAVRMGGILQYRRQSDGKGIVAEFHIPITETSL